MKPMEGRYQTATQVKVLSPVIINNKEVDSFHLLEDSTICIDKARDRLLFRGLSPWYDIEWKLQELGRALTFFAKNRTKCGQVRDQKSELIEDDIPPILAIRSKGYSKAGDFKLKKRELVEDVKAVGLTHSRGVAGAMSCEVNKFHSKGLALICRGKERHSLIIELEQLWKQN